MSIFEIKYASQPWTAIPLVRRVRNYTSGAASQTSIVPDQSFLHSVAVKVGAIGRVDFAGNRTVVEDLADDDEMAGPEDSDVSYVGDIVVEDKWTNSSSREHEVSTEQ